MGTGPVVYSPRPFVPRTNKERARELPVIGWREWVALPDLGVRFVKAKVDTGARSSSIHAFEVEELKRGRKTFVRFKLHPLQRSDEKEIVAEAEVLEYRRVKSSSGDAAMRPVIETNVTVCGKTWPVELTLANRDEMGFRMLLGRQAFRGRFLVDAGSSYYGGKPKKRSDRRGEKRRVGKEEG